MKHSPQCFFTIPVAHENTELKGPLVSFSAKLGDGRQQLYIILFLKWGRAIIKFSRVLPHLSLFFSLPDICPQSVLLVVGPTWALNGAISFAETQGCWAGIGGSTALHEALLLLSQHCAPTFFLGVQPFSESCGQDNKRGQHLTRAGPERFTAFQCNGPFSFLLHFLEEEVTGFMSIFKPYVPRDAEGDSQELHTMYWNTWVASCTQAQLCMCSPAGDHRLLCPGVSASKTPWLKSQCGIAK